MRETIRYWLLFLWQTAKIALWAVLLIGIIFLARVDFSQMNLSPYLLPAIITASAATAPKPATANKDTLPAGRTATLGRESS